MRVLGIDPGTINVGYGIVDEDDGEIVMVSYGVVKLSPKLSMEQKLHTLYQKISELVSLYTPTIAAIEEPFVAGNVKSAFAIGRAQAIAMLVAVNNGLAVFRYLPTEVKQQVTGYGNGSKEQVQEMVKIQLSLSEPVLSPDAADALAIAICHIRRECYNRIIAESR
jgi:crossover junction endodeoxyribonuclease RuvC